MLDNDSYEKSAFNHVIEINSDEETVTDNNE